MRPRGDEELVFSRRDRYKQTRHIRTTRAREEALAQKDIGYTEALGKAGGIGGLLEVFFGYVGALGAHSSVLCGRVAELLMKDENTLRERVEHVLMHKLGCAEDILRAFARASPPSTGHT